MGCLRWCRNARNGPTSGDALPTPIHRPCPHVTQGPAVVATISPTPASAQPPGNIAPNDPMVQTRRITRTAAQTVVVGERGTDGVVAVRNLRPRETSRAGAGQSEGCPTAPCMAGWRHENDWSRSSVHERPSCKRPGERVPCARTLALPRHLKREGEFLLFSPSSIVRRGRGRARSVSTIAIIHPIRCFEIHTVRANPFSLT